MIPFLLRLPRQLSTLEARFDGLLVRLRIQERKIETLEQKIARIETVTTTLGNAVANVAAELKGQSGAPTAEQLARLDRIADALTGDVAELTPTDAHDATTAPPAETTPAETEPTTEAMA